MDFDSPIFSYRGAEKKRDSDKIRVKEKYSEKGSDFVSKYCPITDEDVVYLECLECRNKMCRRNYETERFYLLVAGHPLRPDVMTDVIDYAIAKKRTQAQIIIVSDSEAARRYACFRNLLFRRTEDPIGEAKKLVRKPDCGAIIFIGEEEDRQVLKVMKDLGIRAFGHLF